MNEGRFAAANGKASLRQLPKRKPSPAKKEPAESDAPGGRGCLRVPSGFLSKPPPARSLSRPVAVRSRSTRKAITFQSNPLTPDPIAAQWRSGRGQPGKQLPFNNRNSPTSSRGNTPASTSTTAARSPSPPMTAPAASGLRSIFCAIPSRSRRSPGTKRPRPSSTAPANTGAPSATSRSSKPPS